MTTTTNSLWLEWNERDLKVDYTLHSGREAHYGACVAPEDSYPEDPPEIEIDVVWLDGDINVTDDFYKDGHLPALEDMLYSDDRVWMQGFDDCYPGA